MADIGITYLACPYSHPSAAANLMAGYLMREGRYVFSPISHTHPIALACDLPLGFDYWEAYDKIILNHCLDMVVLTIQGWGESTGVQGEIGYARELDLPVTYRNLPELKI